MSYLSFILHALVDASLWPVIAALLALTCLIVLDIGVAIGERFGGIERFKSLGVQPLNELARKRITRVDIIARISPILGLMGTLIPLGPGISAMGNGDFATLASAITTAFDTTVLGLLIGVLAMLIGRFRRGAYDAALTELEAKNA
ncbi:MAG: MotA/TolQ/ExbB proton channel family protein [Pseudomonadota bacterium]